MPDRSEQRILITQATPGMVLARPVLSKDKINLVGPGTELNDALIQRLMLRGLKRIHVQGTPVPTRSHAPVEEQIADLRQRFARVAKVSLMAYIERAIEAEIGRRG